MTFYHVLLSVGLGRLKHKTRGQGSAGAFSFEDVDWNASRLMHWKYSGASAALNLEGEDRIVKNGGRYEAVREIITELKVLPIRRNRKTPDEKSTERKGLIRVLMSTAPDIVFLPKGLEIVAFGIRIYAHRILDCPVDSQGFSPGWTNSVHEKWIKAKVHNHEWKYHRHSTTILYLLGLPVAPDMDGTVLRDSFEKKFLERTPIQTGDFTAAE